MILRINKEKLKCSLKYSINNERGVYMGFKWKLVFTYGQFHYFILTLPNELGVISQELTATNNEYPKILIENYIIENYIFDNYDKLNAHSEWI